MTVNKETIQLGLIAVNGLISIAANVYSFVSQIKGDSPIPTWEEIIAKNASLQAKIDEEKNGG